MSEIMSARETALKALHAIETEEGYSNIVLDEVLGRIKLKEIDKALVTEIVYGVISRKLTLDYIIAKTSNIKFNKISPWIKNILRMGLYQILYLTKIPVSAACNESVKLAKRYGHKASAGFVNAVLRKAVLTMDSLGEGKKEFSLNAKDLSELESIKQISLMYSHPEWMVEMWINQFGEAFTKELCTANNERPHVSIRINTLKTSGEELKKLLADKEIEFTESKLTNSALILKHGNPINNLYKNGMYTVQDEAAVIVSEVLDPKPGEMVLDVCSAPGGKTTHIAQLMQNDGVVIAWDIYEHRLELVRKSAQRLGIEIIQTKLHDAAEIDEALIGKFDKVLVDVPCSGLGVIRRKPEIKWKRTPEDISSMTCIQEKILEAAAHYVKTDGRLVYSTCTLNRSENENIAAKFIQKNKNYILESINTKIYDIVDNNEGKSYKYFYPHIHGTDGFFIASLVKHS